MLKSSRVLGYLHRNSLVKQHLPLRGLTEKIEISFKSEFQNSKIYFQ